MAGADVSQARRAARSVKSLAESGRLSFACFIIVLLTCRSGHLLAFRFAGLCGPIECWVGWFQTLGRFVTIPVWALADAMPQVFCLCHRPKISSKSAGFSVRVCGRKLRPTVGEIEMAPLAAADAHQSGGRQGR